MLETKLPYSIQALTHDGRDFYAMTWQKYGFAGSKYSVWKITGNVFEYQCHIIYNHNVERHFFVEQGGLLYAGFSYGTTDIAFANKKRGGTFEKYKKGGVLLRNITHPDWPMSEIASCEESIAMIISRNFPQRDMAGVLCAFCSEAAAQVYSSGKLNQVLIVNKNTKKPKLMSLPIPGGEYAKQLVFSRDGMVLAVSGGHGKLYFIDVE